MRLTEPFTINAIQGPVEGRGGHGGGAIELVAPNDVTIGSFGKILCDGGPGEGTSCNDKHAFPFALKSIVLTIIPNQKLFFTSFVSEIKIFHIFLHSIFTTNLSKRHCRRRRRWRLRRCDRHHIWHVCHNRRVTLCERRLRRLRRSGRGSTRWRRRGSRPNRSIRGVYHN